jgi:hypothetical protein
MFYRLRVALAVAFLSLGMLSLASTSQLEARARIEMTTLSSTVYLPLITRSTYSATFPESPASILGNCSPAVHDRYRTTGPDGQAYRTWHAVTVPIDANNPNGPKCSFAHEHGDPPHPSGPLPPFGYSAAVMGMWDELKAHAGFKVFTHYANGNNGFGRPELDYGGLPIDFTVTIHQGSAGRGRLTIRHHSLSFWSRDQQGRITNIHVMADTGNLISKCGPGGPEPARVLVCHDDAAYELWPFDADVGGAWNSGAMNAAITLPMNHMHGNPPCADAACSNITLVSSSEELCGPNFPTCSEKLPFGDPRSIWLGHFRTIHEPDWAWTNAGKASTFCTDAVGVRSACGAGKIQQTVPAINASNSAARLLDRTPNSQGWDKFMNLPLGAPGGN